MRVLVAIAASSIMVSVVANAGTPSLPSATRSADRIARRLTLDTPVGEVASDPAGKAVLAKDLPGLTDHPNFPQFQGLSLREIAPNSHGFITPDSLAKVGADLAAIGR